MTQPILELLLETPVATEIALKGQESLLETPKHHPPMEGIKERASIDVEEALEADLGNLPPDNPEVLLHLAVATATEATQTSNKPLQWQCQGEH